MDETFLYHQIAESIRRDILNKRYKPGERLPSIRALCGEWNCTTGTIQRAYRLLAQDGLVVSRAGSGTQVAGMVPGAAAARRGPLRRANLVHRVEEMLLEAFTAGYELAEIQQAVDLALDRWRALEAVKEEVPSQTLRFVGSHDMVLKGLAGYFFGQVVEGVELQLTFSGSLGGLTALAEGKADLTGCHLWDAQTQTYNAPFIRRVLPRREVVAVTLAHRRIGLILAAGNPHKIHSLADLTQPWARFVNRQAGSGTRVWLDVALANLGIQARQIQGYQNERLTHSDVAQAVADGSADAGLGLETVARAYGLDFVFLNRERYDLVMLTETAQQPALQKLFAWLASAEGKQFIARYPGYESAASGQMVALAAD